MDRFFVEQNDIDLDTGTCCIYGDDVKHISKVLRARVGEKVEICDQRFEYICEISDIKKDVVKLAIIEKINIKRESNIKIKLYQGLPKSTKMEIILQKLTEVGVSEIILVKTKRSVSNVNEAKEEKKLERFERIIYEAAKQSKRIEIPKIKGILSFSEAIEDMKKNDKNICPYENENKLSIKEALKNISEKETLKNISESDNENENLTIGIFVGPEGGFDEEEIEQLKQQETNIVTLGNRILRTETAAIVSSALVLYELGQME
ncbi:MAG: 16S rRNA (uracil(1498)-N(3))-methyltransferase [Clostridioides sp.]|jgi:16S rRNA (uracil1498-N3)-methyltransferase|nr:16S rRNA (uracil(1498)-N(3))-methyltransferase [Clostridioides sp.]